MGRHQKDYFEKGGIYHIYNKVVTGEKLFKKEEDYLSFLSKYEKYFSNYFETFAYCLIPNHFHFLVKVKNFEEINLKKENTNFAQKLLTKKATVDEFLSHQASRMFSSIAISYNNRCIPKRSGPLFKQGLKRVAQNTESQIIHQVCYLHHNPIHHKISSNYSDYRFSSYQAYLTESPSKVSRETCLQLMGGRDNFIKLHENFKMLKQDNIFGEDIG